MYKRQEQEYQGDVYVAHFLELLRDDLGWDTLAERVVRPLAGLRAAPYYGCLLLRPYDEIHLDDPEAPTILHDLVRALGAEPVSFPYNIECCGSYLTVKDPEVSETLSRDIVASAREHGAQVIVTACPLCQFNLDYPQRETGFGRTGDEIPIEERRPEEVTHIRGIRIAPECEVVNPAFDVTPHRYITAIITERGIIREPYEEGIRSWF